MQTQQQRDPFSRFRAWLNNNNFGQYLLPVLAAAAVYGLAILGGMIIGGTSFGFYVIAAAFGIIVTLLIGIYPSTGAYILIFFIYANIADVLEAKYGIADSNRYLISLILVGTLARRVMIDNKPIIFRSTEMSVFALGLAILLSLIFSATEISNAAEGSADALRVAINWIKDFIIFFVVVQFSVDEAVWKNTHVVLIGTAALLSVTTVIQALSGTTNEMFLGLAKAPATNPLALAETPRITGPVDDPNFFAMELLIALPLAFYIGLMNHKRLVKVICAAICLFILTAIGFTYSRGAFIAIAVVTGLIVVERKVGPQRVIVALLIAVPIFLTLAPAGLFNRISSISSLLTPSVGIQTDSSFRGRTSEISVSLLMFSDYPVLGVGFENYEAYYLEYSPQVGLDNRLEERQAHSLYFEILAEQGIVGFMVFLMMLAMVYNGLFRARRLLFRINRAEIVPRVTAVQFGLTAYLIASLFLHGDYERYFYLIVAMAAACSAFAEYQAQIFDGSKQSGHQSYYLIADQSEAVE